LEMESVEKKEKVKKKKKKGGDRWRLKAVTGFKCQQKNMLETLLLLRGPAGGGRFLFLFFRPFLGAFFTLEASSKSERQAPFFEA